MKKTENIVYGELSDVHTLDVYLHDCAVSSAFLYFHGGGLEKGDKSCAEVFAEYLAERGIAFVSADYLL